MSEAPQDPRPESGRPTPRQRRRNTRHSMHLSWAEHKLLFLSKTDLHALQFCTEQTRNIQNSIGAMVLVTGVMAFLSSFFAIDNTFFRDSESLFAPVIVTVIALFYATAIMLFDREVVSATNKAAILGRIPFAILIGLVISFPLELKLQQARIDAQILITVDARNADKIKRIADFEKEYNQTISEELKPLQARRKADQTAYDNAEQHYDAECRRVNCGKRADLRKKEMDAARAQLNKSIADYEQQRPLIIEGVNQRLAQETKDVDQLKKEVTEDKKSHDFLSQYEALEAINKQNPEASKIGWVLRIFFVMFELFPVMMKYFLPYTEYHAYLDARRQIMVNKLFGVTNLADKQIREELAREGTDVKNIANMLAKTEITDILEEVMEDRQIDHRAGEDESGETPPST